MEMVPFVQSESAPGARRMEPARERELRDRLEQRSRSILDDEFVEREWLKFCNQRKHGYVSALLGHNRVVRKLNKKGLLTKLPFAVPEALAIVSTGSMDNPIQLPAMPRVAGASTIRIRPEVGGLPLPVDGPLDLNNRYELFGDANPVGWQRTGCRAF